MRNVFALSLALLMLAGMVFLGGCNYTQKISVFGKFPTPLQETPVMGDAKAEAGIALIDVKGVISEDPETCFGKCPAAVLPDVIARLQLVEHDPSIKAVIIRYNTPGGDATASDILHNEIQEFKQRSGKPVITYMERICASGGVYAGVAGDYIIAHPTTVTGSIGVIFQRINITGLMDKIGVELPASKSGKYKDMGSPFRAATPEEEKMFQGIIDTMYQRFVETVATDRGLPVEEVKTFADGRIFMAQDAVSLKLVDRLGDLHDAYDIARQRAGLQKSSSRLIMWRTEESYHDTAWGPAANGQGIPGDMMSYWSAKLSSILKPGFYYIWPASLASGG